jgi:hypothetical protein
MELYIIIEVLCVKKKLITNRQLVGAEFSRDHHGSIPHNYNRKGVGS